LSQYLNFTKEQLNELLRLNIEAENYEAAAEITVVLEQWDWRQQQGTRAAFFIGGPLHGQTEDVPNFSHEYRVLTMQPIDVLAKTSIQLPIRMDEEEIYLEDMLAPGTFIYQSRH
jgi:hypothetical protein